jgi:hypothetical protein
MLVIDLDMDGFNVVTYCFPGYLTQGPKRSKISKSIRFAFSPNLQSTAAGYKIVIHPRGF